MRSDFVAESFRLSVVARAVEAARHVRCSDCRNSFELSARNVRAARARGEQPRCRTCRGIGTPKPPTQADYDYWTSRFSPDEIRALAGAIWPDTYTS